MLDEVISKQVDLIINWIRVGFIHGVMNTDNMLLSGETIDYLQVDVAVALGNAPTSAAIIAALAARAADPSALVREHVAWALSRHADVIGALLVGACVAALGALLGGGVEPRTRCARPGW